MPLIFVLVLGFFLAPAVCSAETPAVSTPTVSASVIVGTVTIQGNQSVSTHVIERALQLRPGKPFNPEKLKDGKQSLFGTGCFEMVDVVLSTPTPHQVDALVIVRERAARYLKGGVGYGTQTKERVTAGYENHNFFGNLRQFDVKGTYSGFITNPHKYRTAIAETNLIQPYLFDTRLDGQLNLSQEWDNREAYDSVGTTFRASLIRRITKAFDTSLRYRFTTTHLTRVSPEALTPPDQTTISAVGPTLTYDNTDDRFLPFRGWRLIGTWEEALSALGSDVGFHKLEGRTGRFDTLAGWTFFEGMQAGALVPHTGQTADIIPIYERYFLGGANTVRGYSERELGPHDAQGNALGGETFVVGNIEIRHKLYKKLFGVIFLDGGQLFVTDPGETWPDVHIQQLEDLAYSSGFGFRLNTPVGALRLEAGYQINPLGGDDFADRTAIHFSIGEVF